MSIAEEFKALPDPGKSDLRKFAWTVGIAFLLLGGLFWWKHFAVYPYLMGIGAVLVVLGTVVPGILRSVYYGWMAFAIALGFVMTRVILTIFFFLVLMPVGLFFRLIGRDALHRKLDRDAETYWIEKDYLIADRTRFEKFF